MRQTKERPVFIRAAYRYALIGVAVLLAGFSGVSAQNPPTSLQNDQIIGIQQAPKYHPKLESILGELHERYVKQGSIAARVFSKQRALQMEADNIVVVIEVRKGTTLDTAKLTSYGVEILSRYENLWKVKVPVGALVKIAEEMKEVSFIRTPFKPFPLIVSEGVGLTGASNWQKAGYRGQNAKVAIIDGGFVGLSQAIANRQLPNNMTYKDFTGTGIGTGDIHGTAVAEIVYNMAPGAQLYLIKTANEVDLGNAKDYCISNGIHVINCSNGWFDTGGYDGTGIICDIANSANENGILWVNSAGNQAQRHWRGHFIDSNGDKINEFQTSPQISRVNWIGDLPAGTNISVFLSWNDWPTTKQDYDLFLLYDTGPGWYIEASSTTVQDGTQPPIEGIDHVTQRTASYGVAIKNANADGSQELTLFSVFQDYYYQTESSSLVAPADAIGAFTVAAIDKNEWTTGPQESFSSQGPTYDGRMKPDISGPDDTASWTYTTGFFGTSASSPHVAGAAALVKSSNPSWTNAQIRSYLESQAIDMGASGKDNIFGSGRVNLPAIQTISPPTLVFPSNGSTCIPVNSTLTWNASTGAASYHLQVSPTSTFSTTIVDQSGIMDTSHTVSGLSSKTSYYWRVGASNAGGTSDWSNIWSFTTSLRADFNGDGKTNISDFVLFAKTFGKVGGQSGFDVEFDLYGDGKINIQDFVLFTKEFGKTCGN